ASTGVVVEGKHAVVVGRSEIVGKPMVQLLNLSNATVTNCHSLTSNLAQLTSLADILIVAVGQRHLIGVKHVKKGAIVIDVGINRLDNKLYGDVDFEQVKDIASYITPVPGGVGPMTIAMLMSNVIKAAGYDIKTML
ncbi:MAG: bifunctional methylenetetrahydrofolate dehydrogenase/methenyltetrahydrofolate cyclohydrolase, partial [Firmicutes bacterium]|nr:bifunctional methylenetetrahydrofolate dehydrogenase/methenyltetrahydrofolate cyclohydrolase [Bacillota bacterium]